MVEFSGVTLECHWYSWYRPGSDPGIPLVILCRDSHSPLGVGALRVDQQSPEGRDCWTIYYTKSVEEYPSTSGFPPLRTNDTCSLRDRTGSLLDLSTPPSRSRSTPPSDPVSVTLRHSPTQRVLRSFSPETSNTRTLVYGRRVKNSRIGTVEWTVGPRTTT